jgi:hypothetical protein
MTPIIDFQYCLQAQFFFFNRAHLLMDLKPQSSPPHSQPRGMHNSIFYIEELVWLCFVDAVRTACP